MSLNDLVFAKVSDGFTIFDPLIVANGTGAIPVQVTVTNLGPDDLTGLGIYIVPASNLGNLDYPASSPPETDFQDLIEYGTNTDLGNTTIGGMKLTVPQNLGTAIQYVTKSVANSRANKIPFKDLPAGATETFTIELETPPAVTARRLFVDIRID